MHPPSIHDLSILPTSRHSQSLKQHSTLLFPHPFSFQRKSRSLSSSSNNSFTSETSNNSISLNEILAQSISRSSSQNSNSRSSTCFSRADVEEEKAEFGEQFLGLLEPRPGLGWWGVHEVLEEEDRFSRRGSTS